MREDVLIKTSLHIYQSFLTWYEVIVSLIIFVNRASNLAFNMLRRFSAFRTKGNILIYFGSSPLSLEARDRSFKKPKSIR